MRRCPPPRAHSRSSVTSCGMSATRWAGGPGAAQRTDAVFVAMPGAFVGAGSLRIHAQSVVRQAADRWRHVEVWSLDRRANCLEDRRGMDAAAAAGNAALAASTTFGARPWAAIFAGSPPCDVDAGQPFRHRIRAGFSGRSAQRSASRPVRRVGCAIASSSASTTMRPGPMPNCSNVRVRTSWKSSIASACRPSRARAVMIDA